MKNILNILAFVVVSFLAFSCRSSNDNVPKDINDQEEIEKMVVTLTEVENPDHTDVINYIGGVADHELHLENGKKYTVVLDFQIKRNGDYYSALDEIKEEKEDHFITFEFAGIQVDVLRNNDDIERADGARLGISSTWVVKNAPTNAKVQIKLYHLPASVEMNDPSAQNQQGKAVGGEIDVNATFKLINLFHCM